MRKHLRSSNRATLVPAAISPTCATVPLSLLLASSLPCVYHVYATRVYGLGFGRMISKVNSAASCRALGRFEQIAFAVLYIRADIMSHSGLVNLSPTLFVSHRGTLVMMMFITLLYSVLLSKTHGFSL